MIANIHYSLGIKGGGCQQLWPSEMSKNQTKIKFYKVKQLKQEYYQYCLK